MSRPFNLADAKAGHPVASSCGRMLEVFKFEYPMSGTTSDGPLIIGTLYAKSDNAFVTYWYPDGRWFGGGPKHAGDLVMAPVGQLDGVDIYPGDMLTNSNGETVPVPHGVPFRAEDWKAPYPTTRMTGEELYGEHYNRCKGEEYESCVAVANAAIRHGIDNGYLLAPDSDPDVAIVRGRYLAEIAKDIKMKTPYAYAEIPGCNRMHMVAIARHFISLGAARQCRVSAVALPPGAPFTVDEIATELTKVKP